VIIYETVTLLLVLRQIYVYARDGTLRESTLVVLVLKETLVYVMAYVLPVSVFELFTSHLITGRIYTMVILTAVVLSNESIVRCLPREPFSFDLRSLFPQTGLSTEIIPLTEAILSITGNRMVFNLRAGAQRNVLGGDTSTETTEMTVLDFGGGRQDETDVTMASEGTHVKTIGTVPGEAVVREESEPV
jgi:hypothetical protein